MRCMPRAAGGALLCPPGCDATRGFSGDQSSEGLAPVPWEPYPVKTNRYLIYVIAVGVVLAIALIASSGRRDDSQVTASPSPSSTVATSSTASASATATASPGASGSATVSPAGGRYVSVLGYSIETTPPWHKSSCNPAFILQSPTPRG